jgi:hypothetical protein
MVAANRSEPGVAHANDAIVNETGDVAVIPIVPTMSVKDDSAIDLVNHLRDETLPPLTAGTGTEAYVGGVAASFVDVVDQMVSHQGGDHEPALDRGRVRRGRGDLPVGLVQGRGRH